MNNSLPIIINIFSLATTFFCSWYIFIKALNIHMNFKRLLYIISLNLILPPLSMVLRETGFLLNEICLIIATIISLVILFRDKIGTAFITSIISIGIAYIIDCISMILIPILFYCLNYKQINAYTISTSNIFDIICTLLFMSFKRFKNGFVFLQNKENTGLGIFISGMATVIMGLLTQNELIPNTIIPFIIIGIALSFIGICIWIKTVFNRYYHKRLKIRAEEYSKTELADKSKEIEKLSRENASLSSIIHLDNYIISTLESSLDDLKTDSSNSKSIDTLRSLTKQRNEYVNNKIISEKLLPTTGNNDIDAVISDIYIKAASRGIDFNLNVNCDINYLIHNIIEQADFEKFIRNSITNSIVDIENNPDAVGKILITIAKPNDIYEFTIMDNGVTSKGSIDSILETVNKSNASIRANEFDSKNSFTKAITIRFDGLKINNTY